MTLLVPGLWVMLGEETGSVAGTEWIGTVQWSLQKYTLMVKVILF